MFAQPESSAAHSGGADPRAADSSDEAELDVGQQSKSEILFVENGHGGRLACVVLRPC